MIHLSDRSEQPAASNFRETLLDEYAAVSDSRDLLQNLFANSVQFQKLQSLRSQVHTECPMEAAQNRIEELRMSRSILESILQEAKEQGLQVRLRTTVQVDLVEPQDRDGYRAGGSY